LDRGEPAFAFLPGSALSLLCIAEEYFFLFRSRPEGAQRRRVYKE
jgi:hypothetical protein